MPVGALLPQQPPALRHDRRRRPLLQRNFFIFFDAAIGLLFLRRAKRELIGQEQKPSMKGSAFTNGG